MPISNNNNKNKYQKTSGCVFSRGEFRDGEQLQSQRPREIDDSDTTNWRGFCGGSSAVRTTDVRRIPIKDESVHSSV